MTAKALQALFNELADDIYNGKIPQGQINTALANFTATYLMKAITVGYGKGFDDVDYNTPDYEMLSLLEQNIYPFAGAKTLSQLEEMRDLMIDTNGKIKDFNQFAADVLNLHTQYNLHWLRAEYNHAIAASTMAARWQDIQNDKDIYPNLIYQTIGDERVRPQHAALDNIIRPVDDDFWTWAYPPNGWNCRCDAQPTTENETENTLNKNDIPEMFRNNVGIDGSVFSKNHPYYQQANVTANDIKKQLAAIQPDRNQWRNTALKVDTNIEKYENDIINKALQQDKTLTAESLTKGIQKANDNLKKVIKNQDISIQIGGNKGTAKALETLKNILLEGYQSMFQTGTTGGLKDYEKRQSVENKWFDFDNQTDTQYRPKYGYVMGDSRVLRYGLITLKINKRINHLTTITGEDSLTAILPPSRLFKPSVASFIDADEPNIINKINELTNVKTLQQLFKILQKDRPYIEAHIHAPVPPIFITEITIPKSMKLPNDIMALLTSLDIKVNP